jgi:WXG100 family type VII secretion target
VLGDKLSCTVFNEEKERDFNMPSGDQILGTSSSMQSAANKFHGHVIDFDTATRNIQAAVTELQNTWFGGGYDTFTGAMGTWDHHMHIVKTDLTNLADAVQKSDVVFQSVDQDIAKAFKPFDGF